MRQIVTILVSMLWALTVGAGIRRLTWPAFVESAGAIVSGWILGSTVAAAAWFFWPPPAVDVLAVSVGAVEAAISFGVLLGVGLIFHFALDALGRRYPSAVVERALVLCAMAAVWGALVFGLGAAAGPSASL